MSNCYWQWPNHLETWSGLAKSVFCLGKAQKVISNSHHKGDYFIGCMNTMVLQSHYKNPEYPLALRKGRLDTRLFTSNPHAMELLRYLGLQHPLDWWRGKCPDCGDLAALPFSHHPGGDGLPQCLFAEKSSICNNINVTPTVCKVVSVS